MIGFGVGTKVVPLVVVVDVGRPHAAVAGALIWRIADGAVALSEHAASTSTAPPKNRAFFQPMEPPKTGMLVN